MLRCGRRARASPLRPALPHERARTRDGRLAEPIRLPVQRLPTRAAHIPREPRSRSRPRPSPRPSRRCAVPPSGRWPWASRNEPGIFSLDGVAAFRTGGLANAHPLPTGAGSRPAAPGARRRPSDGHAPCAPHARRASAGYNCTLAERCGSGRESTLITSASWTRGPSASDATRLSSTTLPAM